MPAPLRRFARTAAAISLGLGLIACGAPDRAVSPTTALDGVSLAAAPAGVASQSLGLRKAVSPSAIRTHQAAFQAIADQNGGLRSALDATHDAAVMYTRGQLEAAGFNVTVQPFTFDYHGDLTLPVFTRVLPTPPLAYVHTVDFSTMSYSGNGDVTAEVRSVDVEIPSTGNSTSGCEAADFAGFPAGAIALVQRGTCMFRVKVENAMAAGAAAVIVMNEGNTPERQGALAGTINAPAVNIPVIGTSYAIGVSLASSVAAPFARVRTHVANGLVSSSNLIAESPGGDPNSVVVIGASIDSKFGPGINATSGAATMIEIARAYASQERLPNNRLRFIWFGAYAEGLEGSTYYVENLTTDEKARIKAMIELHAVGSPNFGRFIVDWNGLGFTPNPAVDAASDAIKAMFADYFGAIGLAASSKPGVTNALPFRNAGIPYSGLATGVGSAKTAEEAALFGGTAGVAFDPCVFAACDSFSNVSLTALDQMSDAAAHVVLMLSKRNFAQKPLAGN